MCCRLPARRPMEPNGSCGALDRTSPAARTRWRVSSLPRCSCPGGPVPSVAGGGAPTEGGPPLLPAPRPRQAPRHPRQGGMPRPRQPEPPGAPPTARATSGSGPRSAAREAGRHGPNCTHTYAAHTGAPPALPQCSGRGAFMCMAAHAGAGRLCGMSARPGSSIDAGSGRAGCSLVSRRSGAVAVAASAHVHGRSANLCIGRFTRSTA
jgi:hypothetical protein